MIDAVGFAVDHTAFAVFRRSSAESSMYIAGAVSDRHPPCRFKSLKSTPDAAIAVAPPRRAERDANLVGLPPIRVIHALTM